jgi:hypothetical protein
MQLQGSDRFLGQGEIMSLEWYEFSQAVNIANARFVASRTMNIGHVRFSGEKSYFDILHFDILGTCAEMVVAKALGVYYDSSVNTFHNKPDLDWKRGVEVRSTQREDGRLIVRENDANDRLFVLVVGSPPNQRIVGGIFGKNAKKAVYIHRGAGDKADCWMVPQDKLLPLDHPFLNGA